MRRIYFAESETMALILVCADTGRVAVPHINDVPFEECADRGNVVAKDPEWLIEEHQRCPRQATFYVEFGYRSSAEHVGGEGQRDTQEPDRCASARLAVRGIVGLACLSAGCSHVRSMARNWAGRKGEVF